MFYKVPKDVRLNSTHFFIIKIPNKTELNQLTIGDQIEDEKWQYDVNREATKILVLSSGKIDKYEYFTG